MDRDIFATTFVSGLVSVIGSLVKKLMVYYQAVNLDVAEHCQQHVLRQ